MHGGQPAKKERERIGDYVLGGEIGKGSFAVVYKGYRSKSRTPIAIKAVSRNKLTPKLLENLEGEINILKAISHANVVRLEDCIKNEHHIYLIMEFCSGGDLSIYIKKRGKLPTLEYRPYEGADLTFWPHPEEGGLDDRVTRSFLGQLGECSCSVTATCRHFTSSLPIAHASRCHLLGRCANPFSLFPCPAEALQFLRARNLIHRDIKPQNLLLHPPEESDYAQGHPLGIPLLKVADFGFARILPAATLAETLCGSPLYMAPEILRYEKYDAKADLWSVGAVLFEMAVGRPPFRAQNHVELLRRIEKGEDKIKFPDERTVDDTDQPSKALPVPEDIKDLIRQLLKRGPVQRMSFDDFFKSTVWNGYLKTKPRAPLTQLPQGYLSGSSSRESIRASSSSQFKPTRQAPPPDKREKKPVSEPKYFVSSARPSPSPTGSSVDRQADAQTHTTRTSPKKTNQDSDRVKVTTTSEAPVPGPAESGEYVIVEKRTVEVNALADELDAAARRPDGLTRRRSSRTSTALSRPNATPYASSSSPLSYSPPFALSSTPPFASAQPRPSSLHQVTPSPLGSRPILPPSTSTAMTTYGGGITYHQAAQDARWPGDVPGSGLARALTSAGMRWFGSPVNALGNLSRRPWARTSSPRPEQDPEEDALLIELDRVAHKAYVISDFADAKLSHCIYNRSSPPPNVGSLTMLTTSNTARRRSSSGSNSSSDMSSAKIETLCAEALLLYLKSLAFLQHGVEMAKQYWDLKLGTTGTSADLNETIQWFRNRFNDCFDKAEWAKGRCGDDIPESASYVEKLVYDKAIEISRAAAVNELVGEDLVASEVGYENALWMLLAVIDPILHDGIDIGDTDRSMIEKGGFQMIWSVIEKELQS